MHFKSTVILYAVCFITAVWSIGLNKEQIQICIRMMGNRDPATYIKEIPHVMEHEFGISRPDKIFKHENEFHYIIFKKALLALAYRDNKTFDSFEVPMLTSFEVEFYLNKFSQHAVRFGENTYVLVDQLLVLFNELHLTEEEKAKIESYTAIKNLFHAADFLFMMLEILPEGNGLNQEQIEEFINLYRFKKNGTYNFCMDPLKIQNTLNEFHMAIEPLEQSMLFKSNRSAGEVLMELMIVTAERSRRVNENDEIVLSTNEVKSLISEFIERDIDKDGLLIEKEANKFLREFTAKYPQVPALNFSYYEINVAKYLLFQIHAKQCDNY